MRRFGECHVVLVPLNHSSRSPGHHIARSQVSSHESTIKAFSSTVIRLQYMPWSGTKMEIS